MMKKNHASFRNVVTLLVLGVIALSACMPGAAMEEPTFLETAGVDPDTPPDVQPQAIPDDFGEPMDVIAGQVTISLSQSGYSRGDVIEITVANGLDQVIYVEDMKTSCSIVILEVQEGNAWNPLLNCGMERLPRVVAIGTGMGRLVMIDSSGADIAVPGESSLEPGTYRIRFSYRMEPGPEGEEPLSTQSEEFKLSR